MMKERRTLKGVPVAPAVDRGEDGGRAGVKDARIRGETPDAPVTCEGRPTRPSGCRASYWRGRKLVTAHKMCLSLSRDCMQPLVAKEILRSDLRVWSLGTRVRP